MFFRFACAVACVVAVSLVGIELERRTLDLRREVSRQHFRMQVLKDAHARLRWQTQQLGAPTRLIEQVEQGRLNLQPPKNPPRTSDARRVPLLQWQRPSAE